MSQQQTQNLQPQETTICTGSPQGSNLQPLGTSVCTDQPQASNLQPELTVNEIQLQHSSLNSEPKCPETVVSIRIKLFIFFFNFKSFIIFSVLKTI